mgnify:CR=1 FL=1
MRDYWVEPESRTINAKKIIACVLISILVVAVIVVVSLYISNREFRNWIDVEIFRKEVSQDKLATIELDDGDNSNVYAFDDYITILSKNKLSLYGSSGTEEASLDIQITKPVFNATNRFLVIGESNGQKLYLVENKNIVWENQIEGNISQVYVNKNGYVAVIISGTSYKSVVEMFDPEGNVLFNIYLSSTMAVDVTISNDNKYLAMAEIDTSGTIIQSDVRIISVEKAKTDPTNSEEKKYDSEKNRLLVNIKYQDKDKIVCMYTDAISIIENDSENVVFEKDDQKITSQSIELDNNFVTIEEESSGIFSANSVASIMDIDSKNQKDYTVNTSVKEIYTKGNIVALNLGTEVEFINTGGWLVKRYVANQEVTNITISDNIAGIVYRDKVEIINL